MSLTHPYQDHYLRDAFEGFVSWAASEPEAIKAFTSAHPEIKPLATPLERMIDKATGADERTVQKFIDWCVGQFGAPDDL